MPVPALPESLSHLSLDAVIAAAKAQRPPPVHLWNPPLHGHSQMIIKRDGSWYHEGGLISRPAMVRLFASILRRETDGSFVLVTPVEKLTIDVDDAPFVAVEVKAEADTLAFRLNTGEIVVAGAEHPLRVEARGVKERGGEPAPYLCVRPGLDALVARSVYYELAEMALAADTQGLGVWSQGCFFSLEPAA